MRAHFLLVPALSALLALDAPGAMHGAAPSDTASPLWAPPAHVAERDLFHGPWGASLAPDPTAVYTFLKPKRRGVSPGVIVRDPAGRVWHVKQPVGASAEGPVEVVLSRVLSALGFHQPPVYFLPTFVMDDGRKKRQETGGRFRLDEPSMHETEHWSWDDDNLVGTRPYNGLLVILLMFNSWDLKDSNNSIYEVQRNGGLETWYVVRDLGGALGSGGGILSKTRKNHIEGFERARFIKSVDEGFVDFSYKGQRPYLVDRRISVADLEWATRLLTQLSDRQWHDAFRAGGYTPELSERFIDKIKAHIRDAQSEAAAARPVAQGKR